MNKFRHLFILFFLSVSLLGSYTIVSQNYYIANANVEARHSVWRSAWWIPSDTRPHFSRPFARAEADDWTRITIVGVAWNPGRWYSEVTPRRFGYVVVDTVGEWHNWANFERLRGAAW